MGRDDFRDDGKLTSVPDYDPGRSVLVSRMSASGIETSLL